MGKAANRSDNGHRGRICRARDGGSGGRQSRGELRMATRIIRLKVNWLGLRRI
jgi:hypothetical protein